jgi:sortase A
MGWVLRQKSNFYRSFYWPVGNRRGAGASDTFANTFVSGIFCIMRAAGSCRLWTYFGRKPKEKRTMNGQQSQDKRAGAQMGGRSGGQQAAQPGGQPGAQPAAQRNVFSSIEAGRQVSASAQTGGMRKLARVLLVVGLVAVLGAAGLAAFNVGDNVRAQRASMAAQNAVATQINETLADTQRVAINYRNFTDATMPEVWVDGQAYIGQLEIPDLGLTLPVMSQWDYYKLRIAPCRYSGSAYSGNMVICGHNYDSHFGRLKTLEPGAQVRFTDADGNVFNYTVSEVTQVSPTAVDEVTNSSYELTLYTCTIGGQYRVVVRCTEVD